MIEARPCGCRTVFDGSDHVVSVGTCPECLPAGAITWLIENGRQLDLLSDSGVLEPVRGLESIEKYVHDPSKIDQATRAWSSSKSGG